MYPRDELSRINLSDLLSAPLGIMDDLGCFAGMNQEILQEKSWLRWLYSPCIQPGHVTVKSFLVFILEYQLMPHPLMPSDYNTKVEAVLAVRIYLSVHLFFCHTISTQPCSYIWDQCRNIILCDSGFIHQNLAHSLHSWIRIEW